MTARLVKGCPAEMYRVAFDGYLKVGPGAADVLVILFEQSGAPISCRDLCRTLSSHRPLKAGALHERVRVLREAMDSEAIDSDQGTYFLTEVGMAECATAIGEMARAMLGEGWELESPPQLRRPIRPKTPKVSKMQMRLFEDVG